MVLYIMSYPPDQIKGPSTVKLPLSAFIICHDEEAYIGNCIRSLDLCSEIIIVDSGSSDGTVELIKDFQNAGWPIRLEHRSWQGYAAQKQFGLVQCTQPWCISIDADERLDEALKTALPTLLEAPDEIVGWRFVRRPYLVGYGYTPPNVTKRRNLRLIRNGKGAFDLSQTVHEGIKPDGKVRNSKTGSLLHYRPIPIDKHILKINKYSTLKADKIVNAGKPPRFFRLVLEPSFYFFRVYFSRGLWRCGCPGFIEAMSEAVYSFLTESKIYQRHALKKKPSVDTVGQA